MKWIELSESKHPRFGQKVFLFKAAPGPESMDEYSFGSLTGIDRGTQFSFEIGVSLTDEKNVRKDFTHYSVPVPPKP